MNPLSLVTKALEQAKEIEEAQVRFNTVTGISVKDAMAFYCALAAFPTPAQVAIIRNYGVEIAIKHSRSSE